VIGFSHTPLDWAALLCAPIVGSFAGVVVDRTARGENFTTGRSHCEACGRDLQPYDLVPVFSWLALRGRCRYCHAGIRPSHLLIELAAVAIAVSAFLVSTGPALWAGCLLGWTLLVMGLIDLRTLKLPDFGNYLLISGGLAVTYALAADAAIDHAIGAVSGFLTLFAVSWLYRQIRGRDGLGLGDAKLLAAGGAWLGWQALPGILAIAGVAGLIVAIVAQNGHGFDRYRVVAFGPYLALAIWITWLAIAIAVP
jgi:leader peptidase (prepilin peptidase) / N-methyltransferase